MNRKDAEKLVHKVLRNKALSPEEKKALIRMIEKESGYKFRVQL